MNFRFEIVIAFLLWTTQTFAAFQTPVLVVSDVDDTLKIMNVPEKAELALNAFQTNTAFYGMSALYQLILQTQPSAEFVYLTNAYQFLMESTHQEFLKQHHFPKGQYIPKQNIFDSDHKLNQIRKLIHSKQPQTLILIGDNGEKDPQVYHQIQSEFAGSGIQILQFIRIAFPSSIEAGPLTTEKLYPQQIGFVTVMDIALNLATENIFDTAQLQNFIESAVPQLLAQNKNHTYTQDAQSQSKGEDLAYPHFLDCRDYQWKWDGVMVSFNLMPFKEKILGICLPLVGSLAQGH